MNNYSNSNNNNFNNNTVEYNDNKNQTSNEFQNGNFKDKTDIKYDIKYDTQNPQKHSADDNKFPEQNQRINLYTVNVPNIAVSTSSINPFFKESYYKNNVEEKKESQRELEYRHGMWKYMMNVSMQNAVIQMRKIA